MPIWPSPSARPSGIVALASWDEDNRDLIETPPLLFDAGGLPIGYDASQLFGLDGPGRF